jgi:signal transduction histidine kinase
VPTDELLALLRDRVASRVELEFGPANQKQQSLDPSKQKVNAQLYERVLAIAGHDLGNPLGAVMMGASQLKREPGISQQVIRIASSILMSVERMSKIVRDLLDLSNSRLSGGIALKPTPTNAHELCTRIVEELQMAHPGREIRLRAEGDGNGRWDPDRLEQVVSNLAANALHYGPDQTPVTVESLGSEAKWTFSVHNLGEAIPAELLPHVWEPFRRGRGSRSSGGVPHLGIGLFIVRRIVEAHRGTVHVTSEAAEGTRFVVRLPKR